MLFRSVIVPRGDVSARFYDVDAIMLKCLGPSSRVIMHRTLVEMYKQYSQRVNFSYSDSLKDQLETLKASVVANHLTPRRSRENFDLDSLMDSPSSVNASQDSTATPHSYSSLYRQKRGIRSASEEDIR